MFKWFKKEKQQPSIWAICDTHNIWTKVVSYKRPAAMFDWWRVGPFRSEVDCEEFCDKANSARCGKVKLYRSGNILETPYEEEEE